MNLENKTMNRAFAGFRHSHIYAFFALARAGGQTARKLCEKEVGTDFLTDFYNMVSGKEKVTLSMQEVFDSTRQTLKIQELCI